MCSRVAGSTSLGLPRESGNPSTSRCGAQNFHAWKFRCQALHLRHHSFQTVTSTSSLPYSITPRAIFSGKPWRHDGTEHQAIGPQAIGSEVHPLEEVARRRPDDLQEQRSDPQEDRSEELETAPRTLNSTQKHGSDPEADGSEEHDRASRMPDGTQKQESNQQELLAGREIQKYAFGSWADDEGGAVWDAHSIARAVKGRVVTEGPPGSICTDTRSLHPGQWFLVLSGVNFDGHKFLHEALRKQCAGVIANWVPHDWAGGFVQVEGETLKALQRLSSDLRSRYQGTVVAITGSAGKTTMRAMTALALQGLGGHVHETRGNFNNHIGVPLSLMMLKSMSVACVLEMGMNHKGEIQELAEIAKPDVRVLLNVGPAHLEHFPGGLVEVAAAKGEIFENAQPGDLCVVNADDPLVMSVPVPAGVKLVRFGSKEGCDVRLVAAQAIKGGLGVKVVLEHTTRANSSTFNKPHMTPCTSLTGFVDTNSSSNTSSFTKTEYPSSITRTRVEFEIPSPGLHLALNACAAAAVATSLGVSLCSVGRSLSNFQPVGMRCRVEEVGPVGYEQILLINDCYNANPMSVRASLQLLHSMDTRRRVAVLGDMLELGAVSLSFHKGILQLCIDLQLNLVIVVGSGFATAAESFKGREDIVSFRNASSLTNHIARFVSPGDAVLVKGSRGMKMEVFVNAIKAQANLWQSA